MGIDKYLEKEEKEVLHVRLPKSLHRSIAKKAKELGVSITKLTTALFLDYLGKKK